ncbi:MAG: EpsI family protein [Bryobacter sp.]|jgi:EpsI family protein|nr:EpsI family protein [Bryobacter sp. CoA8 C33]
MPGNKPSSSQLKSTLAILSLVLAGQTAAYHKFTRVEKVAAAPPLVGMPAQLGNWVKTQEGYVDAATQEVLRADDTLSRTYANPQLGAAATLFVAAFRSQRHGAAPHSPKNCLPGSGWTPIVNDRILVRLNDRPEPIEVNRYLIQRAESQSLVLYWYQSRNRAVASEYKAKLYTMVDAVKDNRTDTALVRVVIGLGPNADREEVQRAAEDFVRAFYTPLKQFLPS